MHVNNFVVMYAVSTLLVPAVGHVVRWPSSHTVEFSRSNQFGINRRSEGVATSSRLLPSPDRGGREWSKHVH